MDEGIIQMAIAKKGSSKIKSDGVKKREANLKLYAKGNGGRPKGSPNKVSMGIKDAMKWAAENASDEGTVQSYFLKIAKRHPKLFVPMYARLIPMEVNARSTVSATGNMVFESREQMYAQLAARGITKAIVDSLLENRFQKPVLPVPVEVVDNSNQPLLTDASPSEPAAEVFEMKPYPTLEQSIARALKSGVPPATVDAIVNGGWKPTPIDYSKPRVPALTDEERFIRDRDASLNRKPIR
jgi:hypothetical protein